MMESLPFQIKYLELNWYDKDTLVSVTESIHSIVLEFDSVNSKYIAETTIYPKLKGVKKGILAISFRTEPSSNPYIKLPDGTINEFKSIKDPKTGKTWWIHKDRWHKSHNQWYGIAPNIVGKLNLYLPDKLCELIINGCDFTLDQLQDYLQSFKSDLWELILDENSSAHVETQGTDGIGINDEIIEDINALTLNVKKILQTPKVELREVQALKPRRVVKPVNKTFLELSINKNKKLLTSRASAPSYNVPENRYVLFVLERCYKIIKQIVILTANKSKRYQFTIDKIKRQLDSFTDSVKVDRDLVVSDLEKIKQKADLTYWKTLVKERLDNIGFVPEPYSCSTHLYLRVQNKTKDNDGFFVLIWNGEEYCKPSGKTCILSFRNYSHNLCDVFDNGMELSLQCEVNTYEYNNIVIFNVVGFKNIQLMDSTVARQARDTFEKERELGISLARDNWIKRLSPQEIDEQEKEKKALNNRLEYYRESKKLAKRIFCKIEPKYREINQQIRKLKALKIKASSNFPNSMTFVQNPHYQAVHNAYKSILNVTNLTDEDLLLKLEEVEEMGLVNMPLIYERWVLLQIIRVLISNYRFTPLANWKYKLIEAVSTNNTDIELNFSNQMARRTISLWYEKTLLNNKRPDFVLDLTWLPENSEQQEQEVEQEEGIKRLIIDAKFYDKSTFDRAGGVYSKIEELYTSKDYSEGGSNPVFLVHPCSEALTKKYTAQTWGKCSFLGEVALLGSDTPPDHNKGAIFLNPIDRILFSDELQRLLGLFLQYKLENTKITDKSTDRTKATPICIRCGSSNFSQLKKTSGYRDNNGQWVPRTPKSVWLKCVECEQIQIHNHCASSRDCGSRIIKNGLYWTYHSARALEPFNIKCPSCGEWGAW